VNPIRKMAVAPERVCNAAPPSRARELARYWGVVLAWMVFISVLSGDPFSASNTHRYLDPILRYFFPDLTASEFASAHWCIRKSAHFSEYFILGCLTYWACRRGRTPRWRTTWMLQALGLATLYGLVDEAHQAFVPSRSPSLLDSGIDSLGAATSQVLIYLRHLLRTRISLLRRE
jgi:VanZ family protein